MATILEKSMTNGFKEPLEKVMKNYVIQGFYFFNGVKQDVFLKIIVTKF